MVKRGSTTFSATKVAKAGLAASAALTRILELEKEVSRLRHHVSVLSRWNHVCQKELDGLREEGKGGASSKEPEPQVVAEPPEPVVVVEEASSVAFEEVAESVDREVASSEAQGEDRVEVREEVVYDDRMSDLRDRMSDEDVVVGGKIIPLSGYTPVVEEEGRTVVPVVPLGPAGLAPGGPRAMRMRGDRPAQWRLVGIERRGELERLRSGIVGEGGGGGRVARLRNGIGGDSFRTRGSYARAGRGGQGGVRDEGFEPYRRWR